MPNPRIRPRDKRARAAAIFIHKGALQAPVGWLEVIRRRDRVYSASARLAANDTFGTRKSVAVTISATTNIEVKVR
jgi:hypothetical protein